MNDVVVRLRSKAKEVMGRATGNKRMEHEARLEQEIVDIKRKAEHALRELGYDYRD